MLPPNTYCWCKERRLYTYPIFIPLQSGSRDPLCQPAATAGESAQQQLGMPRSGDTTYRLLWPIRCQLSIFSPALAAGEPDHVTRPEWPKNRQADTAFIHKSGSIFRTSFSLNSTVRSQERTNQSQKCSSPPPNTYAKTSLGALGLLK